MYNLASVYRLILGSILGLVTFSVYSSASSTTPPAAETTSSTCRIMMVNAIKKMPNQNFVQFGQGWIFTYPFDNSLFILTPAHVVDGADNISAGCHLTAKLKTTLVAISPTLDLAVLRIDPEDQKQLSKILEPVFDYSMNLRNPEIAKQVGFVAGVFQFESRRRLNTVTVWELELNKGLGDDQLFPYLRTYLAGTAVQPGMSGSPLFSSDNLKVPLGMVTRTKVNDHYSLVIPTNEILMYIPALVAGKDPWRENPMNKAHVDYETTFDSTTKALIRHRVVYAQDFSGKPMKFSEACAHAQFKDSSDWVYSSESRQDVGGSWADTEGEEVGGSWADTVGDEIVAKTSFGKHYTGFPTPFLRFKVNNGNVDEASAKTNGYYKDPNPCSGEGLLLENGKILLGVSNEKDQIFAKIDDAQSLMRFMAKYKVKWHDLLKENGIYKSDEAIPYLGICRSSLLGRDLYAGGEAIGEGSIEPVLHQSLEYVYQAQAEFIPEKPATFWNFGLNAKAHSYITCAEEYKNKVVEIQIINNHYAIDIYITSKGAAGTLLFTLDDKPTFYTSYFASETSNYWDRVITTKDGFKIAINLRPDAAIGSIRIIEIPAPFKSQILRDSKRYEIPYWMMGVDLIIGKPK